MKKRIYNEEQFNISKWSGGVTAQYAIYPESSKYIDRDFIWRLSSATVDVEESVFTKLPDYDRVLMVLEGDAVLAHGDERTVKLGAYDQDSFDGGTKTTCFGKIKDYNLMVKKGCSGRMFLMDAQSAAEPIEKGEQGAHTNASYGVYCISGYAVVSAGGDSHMVGEGKQLVMDFDAGEAAELMVMGDGKVIVTEVFYTKLAHAAVEIPEEKATFEDFKTAFKLARSRTKWKQMTKKNKDVWYDEALQDKLAFLDRTYIGIILWVLVVLAFLVLGVKFISHIGIVIMIVVWTILYALVVSPLIYMIVLPKPIKAHIKDVNNLTEYEQQLYEQELGKNEMTDKLLHKYRHSGEEGWNVDGEESLISRLKK